MNKHPCSPFSLIVHSEKYTIFLYACKQFVPNRIYRILEYIFHVIQAFLIFQLALRAFSYHLYLCSLWNIEIYLHCFSRFPNILLIKKCISCFILSDKDNSCGPISGLRVPFNCFISQTDKYWYMEIFRDFTAVVYFIYLFVTLSIPRSTKSACIYMPLSHVHVHLFIFIIVNVNLT